MHFNKRKISEICATALLAGGLVTCIAPAVAATAAGTMIKNLATVTYEDENGNTYSAQSNEAVITVKQVYSAELSADATKEAAAGQTVYIQHTLTNTGNGTDTYTLTTDDTSAIMYLDSNGNGLADAGEQTIAQGGTITLAAGESAEIVIAKVVPNTSSPGDVLTVKLTAAATDGTVEDVGSNSDADTLDISATNDDTITVTNNAVLNYTKSAVLDATNHQITYTLTVTNTGNIAATGVLIYDGLPAGTTLVGTPTAAGLLTANGDTLPASTTLDEDADNVDYNHDGATSGIVDAISALDASIAPGQTVSITFVAGYDPATFNNNAVPGSAGDVIKNTAYLSGDLNGPAADPVGGFDPIPSNPTQTTLPQTYLVAADDTGTGAANGTNNGGDDDAAVDDTQTVDVAPSGSTVLFNVVLTNDGTGPDTLELAINKGDFPAGTTFTYWNATGTAQLTDTNSEGGVDSGMLDSGESVTIMVKAVLPSGATDANSDPGTDGYTATLTATSANDPSATPISDTTSLYLGNITAPGVDIADSAAGIVAGNEDPATGLPLSGTRTTSQTGIVGGTVKLPIYIDNESGSSDSYQLTTDPLPTGWTVQFYKADGSGNPTGAPLSTTALLPAGATDVAYVAVVTIPADPAYAEADYTGAGGIDANGDGDLDQPIVININSANSGASDSMIDAIDVADLAQVTLTPPGSNQIQPGGSVDYIHTLDNTGNTEETLELTATNGDATWNNTVMVDTDGDGTPDTTLAQLTDTDVIYGIGPDGSSVQIDVSGTADGSPDVTLPPGVSMTLTPTVYAPSDAAPGSTDILTINATNLDPTAPSAQVEDVSSVILGQVRLTKTVAYDAEPCDGTPESAFAPTLTTEIPPGSCAIWEIQAENQGDAPAKNVVITDSVPEFTTFETGSMLYSPNASTALAATTADTGAYNATTDEVTFWVGTGADGNDDSPADGIRGGTMAPGEIVTVRFSTKID